MKDEIEFDVLDPLPSPPPPQLTPRNQGASLTETELNKAINSVYDHYIDSLRYGVGKEWVVDETNGFNMREYEVDVGVPNLLESLL